MIALFNKLLDWFKALFWKEEMELTLVGLQYSGKTTFVNVIAVRGAGRGARGGDGAWGRPVPARRSPGNRVAAWPGRAPRGGEAGPWGLARPVETRGRATGSPAPPGWHGWGGGPGDRAGTRDLQPQGVTRPEGSYARGDQPPPPPRKGA